MFSGDQIKAFMIYERGYQVNYFSIFHPSIFSFCGEQEHWNVIASDNVKP